jgi:hypothetical protein
VPWKLPKQRYTTDSALAHKTEDANDVTFQRYYHLFVERELDGLIDAEQCTVIKSGYDRDNYFVVFQKN